MQASRGIHCHACAAAGARLGPGSMGCVPGYSRGRLGGGAAAQAVVEALLSWRWCCLLGQSAEACGVCGHGTSNMRGLAWPGGARHYPAMVKAGPGVARRGRAREAWTSGGAPPSPRTPSRRSRCQRAEQCVMRSDHLLSMTTEISRIGTAAIAPMASLASGSAAWSHPRAVLRQHGACVAAASFVRLCWDSPWPQGNHVGGAARGGVWLRHRWAAWRAVDGASTRLRGVTWMHP